MQFFNESRKYRFDYVRYVRDECSQRFSTARFLLAHSKKLNMDTESDPIVRDLAHNTYIAEDKWHGDDKDDVDQVHLVNREEHNR